MRVLIGLALISSAYTSYVDEPIKPKHGTPPRRTYPEQPARYVANDFTRQETQELDTVAVAHPTVLLGHPIQTTEQTIRIIDMAALRVLQIPMDKAA
ncbi:unnamed protein product [Nippostrongylus brasiliensis]|uniref:Secreted protein n=1 Tax=Nippostrongylus brasiliensis TaxID=27835 RepID=A0A0N4YJ56_NIPBR|nr:unnamed protein product [Nippostrongylus brasiliensis]